MKKIRGMILSFFIVSLTFAQVPNGGFENWTNGQPDNWSTSNANTLYTNVTRTTKAHSGSYALKGEVIDTPLSGILSIINPFIKTGEKGEGFPISQRYSNLNGYYQFSADSGDIFIVNVTMMKAGKQMAFSVDSLNPSSSYKLFSSNITYLSSEVPDTCIIQFTIWGPSGGVDYHVGSYFILDDLSLSGTATAVKPNSNIPKEYNLYQNYPNPFNPSTAIEYSIPKSGLVQLTIYNVLGKKVSTLVDRYEPDGIHHVNFNASNLASGIYFYKLRVNNFTAVKKLMLIK
jgi:hypothetical protein